MKSLGLFVHEGVTSSHEVGHVVEVFRGWCCKTIGAPYIFDTPKTGGRVFQWRGNYSLYLTVIYIAV